MVEVRMPARYGSGLTWWIVSLGVLVAVVFSGLILWEQGRQRDLVVARALLSAENLAIALDEHTRATIQSTDLAIQDLSRAVGEYFDHGSQGRQFIHDELRKKKALVPHISRFVFADENGSVSVDSQNATMPEIHVSDRDYFLQAKRNPDGGLYISAPFANRRDGSQIISLVRPVRRSDGRFAGIILAALDPGYFQQFHDRLELGFNSVVAVFTLDGTMIARAPHRAESVGSDYSDDLIFQELAAGRTAGAHFNPNHRDSSARYVAFRKMRDYPLVVAVAMDQREVLSPYETTRWTAMLSIATLIFILVQLTAIIVSQVRRRERARQLLEATLANVNQGVLVFDANQRLVRFNGQYQDMFEHPPGFLRRGVSYEEVLRAVVSRGEYDGRDAEALIAERLGGAARGEETNTLHRRPDGRCVQVYRKPMASGGFIITFTDVTASMRATEESARMASLMQLVMGSVHQGIRVYDKNFKLVAANRRITEAFGYPEEFIKPELDYEQSVRIAAGLGEYGPGDVEEIVAQRMDLARNQLQRTALALTPSGRYVQKHRAPIQGGGFVAIYTDVTDLIKIEEELARKSALLSTALENMGDGVLVFDEHLRLLNFNTRWIDIWQMPPEMTKVGVSLADIIRFHLKRGEYGPVSDHEAYIAQRIGEVIKRKMTVYEHVRPDGRVILIRRQYAPNGLVIINHTDITRIKQAEREAATKSALLEAVLENIAHGITVYDADLTLVAFNNNYVELQGYERDDIHLGMTYEEVLRLAVRRGNFGHVDNEKAIRQRIAEVREQRYYRNEYRARSGRYLTMRRTPMPDGGFVSVFADVTDRKRAEGALKASEARYRTLVTSTSQIIWSADAEGYITEAAPAWGMFTGQSEEEVLGWGWIKAVHPDDTAYARRMWGLAIEKQTPVDMEYRVRGKDGSYRTLAVHGAPVRNDDGTIREWVGICEDVTEQRLAERELVNKTAQLEAITENMAQGISVYDADARLLAFNRRYADLFEFPPGFPEVGTNFEEIIRRNAVRGEYGPDHEEQVRRRVESARNGENYRNEYTRPNGVTIFVNRVPMPGGGFINTFTDMSDRKRAEQAMRESEESLRAILDNVADAIITTDKSGLIQSFNPAAEQIFGHGSKEVVGRDIRVLIPASYALPPNKSDLFPALSPREMMGQRKDGTLFPMDIAVTSVELPGRWMQIAIIRDITEQKVLQSQLFQASKLATVGEMAAGMAHEMNQPLNVMRMAADNALIRMERGLADEAYLQQNLSLIADQSERLGKLILHMRVFSRVDKVGFEPFDPRSSIEAAAELMNRQLTLKNIQLKMSLPDSCRLVLGRPSQLEQVVINLISNAQDSIVDLVRRAADATKPAAGAGIGAIDIRLRDTADGIVIAIRDTGGGIPDSIVTRIFDPFFTTKEVGKGTGLGLSVSYGIITAMGGKIDAANVRGGAEFTIRLPASDSGGGQTSDVSLDESAPR